MKNISNISPQNSFGFTPLHFAAAKGCLSICQLINENYGRLDMADNSGITPIHIAAIRGHLSVYQFLLQQLEDKNPKVNFNLSFSQLIRKIRIEYSIDISNICLLLQADEKWAYL